MADLLTVHLDATEFGTLSADVIVRDNISIAASQAQAKMDNVWVEPYTQTVMIKPKQFADDFYLDNSVDRFGKDKWILTDAHWDEMRREYDRYLISDGDDETIETKKIFERNAGFHFESFIFGDQADRYQVLDLWFGQWLLSIWSDGYSELYLASAPTIKRATGYLTSSSRNTLCNRLSSIVIAPTSEGKLFVRRNGVAGFAYQLPADELDDQNPDIISAASFKVKAYGKIRFGLTQLAYTTDEADDIYYISPNLILP